MKKTILYPGFLILLTCCTAWLFSCTDSDDNGQSRFTWTYKGTTYTANYTFASSVEDLGPNIIGGLGNTALAPGSGVRFKIIPLITGLHIAGTGQSPVQFIDTEGNNLQAAGIVTITSTSNKRLSGSFQLEVGPSGDQHTVEGVIENVPVTP